MRLTNKGPLGVEPSWCRLTGGRNPGRARDPSKLGRKESNLQPSASEAAALPVAPLPNGLLGNGRGENRTHRAPKERRGYNPLDHHWSPHVRSSLAMHGRKESNLQRRVLEARTLADGVSAVGLCLSLLRRRPAESRRTKSARLTMSRPILRPGAPCGARDVSGPAHASRASRRAAR